MTQRRRAAARNLRAIRDGDARIELPDGGSAELKGGALDVRDAQGHLVVRYRDGAAEICAPAGDLRLRAPNGRVVIEGADVSIAAERDVVHRAGRSMSLSGGTDAPQVHLERSGARVDVDKLELRSKIVAGAVESAQLAAKHLGVAAERVMTHADHWELTADRAVAKSRTALREVVELAEERVGRLKTFVEQAFTLSSRRTAMRSAEETSIDGKRILLG